MTPNILQCLVLVICCLGIRTLFGCSNSEIDNLDVELGEHVSGTKLGAEVVIENDVGRTFNTLNVKVSCSCVDVVFTPHELLPNRRQVLPVTIDTTGKAAGFYKDTLSLRTDLDENSQFIVNLLYEIANGPYVSPETLHQLVPVTDGVDFELSLETDINHGFKLSSIGASTSNVEIVPASESLELSEGDPIKFQVHVTRPESGLQHFFSRIQIEVSDPEENLTRFVVPIYVVFSP